MDCGYAICSTFLPGDRQVAVGTKNGEILIYDIASSTLIETVKAHDGAVWSMHVRADGEALVSGSADKDVKFWEFEHKASDSDNVSVLALINVIKYRSDTCDIAAKPEAPVIGAYTYAQDDRGCIISQIQPEREVTCCSTVRLDSQGVLSGQLKILPVVVWP